ncbi:hypothetical protein MA47_07990 [Corynebacterium auriscanis]|uniref:PPE family domain-containing protein n=1 Tax=Corynebacterium auriscanis TaxID=99807 RepID=A0A0A2DGW4_9CORY|nr:hypothetical protein [Corynebacterium auriscanis]KGM18410.1 hypothetical protein MA47_07990 [Corynebacterium auriscanis]
MDTIENIRERIQWVHHLFAAHISGFELQEELSKASLDSVHSHVTRNASEHQLQLPSNAERQIDNLIYNVPIAAGEATTPLAALIAAFQGDDSVPLLAAKRWSDAGRQLGTAMASLNNASNMIAASAQGTSFDAARAAIGDLVKLGTVVSANTMTMAASVGQFPTIRATNLAALHSIQASTALITSPAERLAAEQAAVASFVSSHLQPSLELVKPPVSNLGVPITIRSGGGTLSAGAFGDSSAPAVINTINGTTESAAPTATGTMAHHASHAAAQAGHGSPSQVVATPASAATSPVSTPPSPPHLTPATGAPVAAHAPSAGSPLHLVSPAPTANAQVASVRPATLALRLRPNPRSPFLGLYRTSPRFPLRARHHQRAELRGSSGVCLGRLRWDPPVRLQREVPIQPRDAPPVPLACPVYHMLPRPSASPTWCAARSAQPRLARAHNHRRARGERWASAVEAQQPKPAPRYSTSASPTASISLGSSWDGSRSGGPCGR